MHDLAQDHIATAVGRPRPDTEPVMVATGGQQGETRLSREVEAAGAQRPSTIRAMLMWAVIAWIVPTWLCVAIGIVGFYQFERERLSQSTISIARAIAAGIDRELTGKMAATQVVALSPHLRSDDYAAFHREASELVPVLLGTNLVLADATGQQLVNTLRPYGEPLPFRTDVGSLRKVFAAGKPTVSDIVIGAVSRQPVFSIDVPVVRGSAVRYSLALGISSRQFSELLRQQRLAPSWVVSIFDLSGGIVARTHAPERFVGQKGPPELLKAMTGAPHGVIEASTLEGVPVIAAFSRSEVSSWTVAIGVPTAQLYGELRTFLLFSGSGALTLLGASIALAGYQSAKIRHAVRALIPPALALGRGEVPNITPLHVREADDVAQALDRAFHLLQSRTLERDDAHQDKQDAEFIARNIADAYRRVEAREQGARGICLRGFA